MWLAIGTTGLISAALLQIGNFPVKFKSTAHIPSPRLTSDTITIQCWASENSYHILVPLNRIDFPSSSLNWTMQERKREIWEQLCVQMFGTMKILHRQALLLQKLEKKLTCSCFKLTLPKQWAMSFTLENTLQSIQQVVQITFRKYLMMSLEPMNLNTLIC